MQVSTNWVNCVYCF